MYSKALNASHYIETLSHTAHIVHGEQPARLGFVNFIKLSLLSA